jgi:glycolate oxidase iron-sulfur subunit
MQTRITEEFRETGDGRAADAILRKCVHCGFCLATCPTYTLLGDELDSPRGRIYLLKQLFEGGVITGVTQRHLDRCLGCRACETTCPSGVNYGALLRIGRPLVASRAPRTFADRLWRLILRVVLGRRAVFSTLLGAARALRPLLPADLRRRIPVARPVPRAPARAHSRNILLLEGCVQPAIAPSIDGATRLVLDRLDIGVTTVRGCCGALSEHLGAPEDARRHARANIDAWSGALETGATAIVASASACALQLREYPALLCDDPRYREKAARVGALARDLSEIVYGERERLLARFAAGRPVVPIAFQSPCTLQHGLKLRGRVEPLLESAGFRLLPVADGHLCCGAAGPYTLLESELSDALLARKISALAALSPEVIATANVGCMAHLERGSTVPVRHWVELIAERLGAG